MSLALLDQADRAAKSRHVLQSAHNLVSYNQGIMVTDRQKRILITGGSSVLGLNLASALLAEGADVTLLVRDGVHDRIGTLARRVHVETVDFWDVASMKGRARGHGTVIHTVGSLREDQGAGYTFERLNVIPARNAASMCASDGVPRLILLSTVRVPWLNRHYVRSKREAEDAARRFGVHCTVVRAPLFFIRGSERPFFFRLLSTLGSIPPLSWFFMRNAAPMPLDVLVRGVARLALQTDNPRRIVHARDLRRFNTRDELRGRLPAAQTFSSSTAEALPFDQVDDEVIHLKR